MAGLPAVLAVPALGVSPSLAAGGDVQPFTVAAPAVTGPVPSTSADFPFIADGFSVMPPVPAGYQEKEYFFSGTANLYQWTPTGIEVVTPCPASVTEGDGCTNLPYTTRMLVKYPANPAKFSGTVVIEPMNPTAGYDLAAVWDRSRDYFVRNGDIFVGWTSKSVTVATLKGWNPQRYAPLHWPYVPFTAGGNSGVYDGMTFDIAAQIGALFKANGPASPVHGYRVQRVFESGFSQDGGFTFTQAEVFNALERMPGGGPVSDGYVPGGTTGPSNLNFGLTAAGALPAGDPRHQMQPRDVPVIHINTETEVALGLLRGPEGLAYRRPDNDAANDRYRLWEVPGSSHVSNDSNAPQIDIVLNFEELFGTPPPPLGCAHMGVPGVVDPNTFPFSYVANAAFADLTRWVTDGVPPPRAERIALTPAPQPQIARDAFGNALGGVRTPFVDVPTATYVPTDAGGGFCLIYGYNVPFSHATLQSIYNSHGDYVQQVVRDAQQDVREGFWLGPDADAVKEAAAHAEVP